MKLEKQLDVSLQVELRGNINWIEVVCDLTEANLTLPNQPAEFNLKFVCLHFSTDSVSDYDLTVNYI